MITSGLHGWENGAPSWGQSDGWEIWEKIRHRRVWPVHRYKVVYIYFWLLKNKTEYSVRHSRSLALESQFQVRTSKFPPFSRCYLSRDLRNIKNLSVFIMEWWYHKDSRASCRSTRLSPVRRSSFLAGWPKIIKISFCPFQGDVSDNRNPSLVHINVMPFLLFINSFSMIVFINKLVFWI